ncbi:LysM peptidoglycan-binding domain-containing protein [Cryptosporangium minutisporangium]|uniref:LysM peptidoglycan-binding domain-containing protein n=1 Tax=Cryptosporangium minutisporangium TaxID=113569 RepID=UPI0031EF78D0
MPTLSDVPNPPGEAAESDPFEQALRVGAGRSPVRAVVSGGRARRSRRSARAATPCPSPAGEGAPRLPRQRSGRCRSGAGVGLSEMVADDTAASGPVPRARGGAGEGGLPERRRPAPCGTHSGPPPLRLTRRGRALVRSVVLLGVVLMAFAVSVSARTDGVTPVSSRSMIVTERDTLWTIADEIAPERPRSATMADIRELNDMSDSTVRVGERLLLPAY